MKHIYVTRPDMPDFEEFTKKLKHLWQTRFLTNNGEFHQEFEKQLADFLGVNNVCLFANGTIALIVALQALRITGEVITTPFSFVATTHALYWNGIKPVFCDIKEGDANIDPDKLESLITPKTTAILPVHIYGNPCDNERIQYIADKYGLKIIYDAAHAFAVRKNGISVLNWGDLSILSFHATKVFHTFEGGAIVCKDEMVKKRIDYLKNFGFAGEEEVVAPGINGKMNEVSAIMGLLQLKIYNKNLEKRKKLTKLYEQLLDGVEGIRFIRKKPDVEANYSYFPIFIDKEKFGHSRDEVFKKLRSKNIFVRKYFYPLISEFPMYKNLPSANRENLPVAYKLSRQVLTLPLYAELDENQVKLIVKTILEK